MFTKSGRLILLEIITSYGAIGFPFNFRLATNVPSGDPEDVVTGDFTECTFPGYAEISYPTHANAVLDGSDRGKLVFNTMIWTAGSIVTPETALSIYCHCSSSSGLMAGLVWWKELPAPVTVATPGELISQIVTWYDRDFVP